MSELDELLDFVDAAYDAAKAGRLEAETVFVQAQNDRYAVYRAVARERGTNLSDLLKARTASVLASGRRQDRRRDAHHGGDRVIETDALNGLIAALETFVPPLIRSGVLKPEPFAAAIRTTSAWIPCSQCGGSGTDLIGASDLLCDDCRGTGYAPASPFCFLHDDPKDCPGGGPCL